MNLSKNNLGFTIVEFIVLVGVVAVLAAGSFFALRSGERLGEAQDAQRWADITAIAKAIELYELDNDSLPSDFSTSTLSVGEKFVLCSAESSLSCDGQNTTCLVVDDTDFLAFLPDIPIDPSKVDDTDTGYYITRDTSNALVVGACDSYDTSSELRYVAKASLPDVVSDCGDGFIDEDEACDDGDNITEGCGNNHTETAGTYCNSTCSATVVLTEDEACDDNNTYTETCGDGALHYGTYCDATCENELSLTETCEYYNWTNDCEMSKIGWVTEADLGGSGWCQSNCRMNAGYCVPLLMK